LVERIIKTLKQLILRYIYKYGWPKSENECDDVQQVLDACTWFYNHKFLHVIKAMPYDVFHSTDESRQKITIIRQPLLKVGQIV
jgi:hypothetical protein